MEFGRLEFKLKFYRKFFNCFPVRRRSFNVQSITMKFLILAAIIGLAAANPMNLDPIKVAMAMKVLNMDVSDMHGCSTNADCSAIADKPICCKQFKLCKAANIPPMQMAGTSAELLDFLKRRQFDLKIGFLLIM
jgi:hypothetical protein